MVGCAVLEMNRVAGEWMEQFAPVFGPVCVFSEDENGFLYINGKLLTSLQGLVLARAGFEEDQIAFDFEDGRRLEVVIDMTEEEEPYVESVWIGYAELTM